MKKHDDMFRPAEVDEQIEQALQSRQDGQQQPESTPLIHQLHELYNNDEQHHHQAMARAWSRIQERSARKTVLHRLPARHVSFPDRRTFKHPYRQPTLLIACIMITLLLSSAFIFLEANRQRQQAAIKTPETATTSANTTPLGSSIGQISLGMTPDEIKAIIPTTSYTEKPVEGLSPLLHRQYAETGLSLYFQRTPDTNTGAWTLFQIKISSSWRQESATLGGTAEGFNLGMPLSEFEKRYQSYLSHPISIPTPTMDSMPTPTMDLTPTMDSMPTPTPTPALVDRCVSDGLYITLCATFDTSNTAIQLSLAKIL